MRTDGRIRDRATVTHPEVVLVAATGNGESANAGGVVELLRACRAHPDLAVWWLTIVEAAELRIEHSLELTRADLVLFVTEEPGGAGPLEFRRVDHDESHRIAADGDVVSPEDVLHALSTLSRREQLPPAFALTVGRRSDGKPARERERNPDAPFDFLLNLLKSPDAQRWDEKAQRPAAADRVARIQADSA
jgi:hypothetical protein